MKKLAALLIAALMGVSLCGCDPARAANLPPQIIPSPTAEVIGAPEEEPAEIAPSPSPSPEPESVTIKVRVVGDVMLHEAQQDSAKTEGGYDFSEYFARINGELSCADFTIGNLETPVADKPASGYPRFNAPAELLDELKAVGFDAFTLANNHVLDKGASGIDDTVDNLAERGLLYFGVSKGNEDYSVTIVDVNGIRLALLGYTQGTNGIEDKGGQVRYLTEGNIKNDVAAARAEGADFIIAFPHWGAEYYQGIHASTVRWAQKLADAGVDLILGSHPHVLEPMDRITASDGREVVVVYSMGNFISNQQKDPNFTGVIIEASITREADGTTELDSIGWLPTFVYKHSGKARYMYEVLCADSDPVEGMDSSAKRKLKRAAGYAAETFDNDFSVHLSPLGTE